LLVLRDGSMQTRRIHIGIAGAVLVAMWLAAREGFGRFDEGHSTLFFAFVLELALLMAIGLFRAQPRLRAAALGISAAAFLVAATGTLPLLYPFDRQWSLTVAVDTVRAISSHDYAQELQARDSAALAEAYDITPELRSALGSAPTLVDPWDVSALAATNARWAPLPAFQLYAAFTPALDELNVASLASAPRQILRRAAYGSIDRRNPYWESPRYQMAVYCGYSIVFSTADWQVLHPRPVSRCGEPVAGSAIAFTSGEAVQVPREAGWITVATITIHDDALGTLAGYVLRPPAVYVSYGDTQWRLADRGPAPLLLNAPIADPAFAGLPIEPRETLTLSAAGTISFSFVPVAA
jgi:hypothetical protein